MLNQYFELLYFVFKLIYRLCTANLETHFKTRKLEVFLRIGNSFSELYLIQSVDKRVCSNN